MEFKSVSKNCKKEWYILRSIAFVLLLAGFVGLCFASTEDKSDKIAKITFLIILALPLAWSAVYAFVFPRLQYDRLKFRIDENRIEKQSGVIFLRKAYVPFVRIQHVEVFRGIFDRLFGMSTVIIFTAGSAVRLPNLDIAQADEAVAQIRSLLAGEGGDND